MHVQLKMWATGQNLRAVWISTVIWAILSLLSITTIMFSLWLQVYQQLGHHQLGRSGMHQIFFTHKRQPRIVCLMQKCIRHTPLYQSLVHTFSHSLGWVTLEIRNMLRKQSFWNGGNNVVFLQIKSQDQSFKTKQASQQSYEYFMRLVEPHYLRIFATTL